MRNLFCCLLIVLGFSFVNAQERSILVHVKNTNNLKSVPSFTIKFQQSSTASKVSVYQSTNNQQQHEFIVPEGKYTISVEAAGFKPMLTQLPIDANIGTINFELVPLHDDSFNAAYIKSKHTSGYIFLTGYLMDEQTQVPLANVDIRNANNQLLATTSSNGFYEFLLPVSSTEAKLYLSKAGYHASVKQLTRLCDGDDQLNNFTLSSINPQPNVQIRLSEMATSNENLRTTETQTTTCPTTIKVGTTCPTSTSCSGVDVVAMETYTRRVLIAEWLSCWGNPAGGMNSLQAGAVAIRSYGMWYVYHPINATYDICSSTSCQVYGTTETTNGNNATANTANYILETSGAVAKAEYAAEQNNHPTCGNGFTGTGATAWPCTADAVCTGQTYNGHGRGMCQNGSARWATGLALTSSSCSFGAANAFGPQTWQWIIGHYYPSYTLTTCVAGTACVTPSTPVPTFGTTACPGTATTQTGTNLTWNTVSGANGYTISISKYPYGSANLITGFPCSNYGNQATITSGLQTGMLYRWNMTATGDCNVSTCTSGTSATNYFHVPPVITANSGGCMSTTAVTPGSGSTVTYNWYQVGNSTAVQSGSSTLFVPTNPGNYYLVIQYSGSANCSGTVVTNSSNILTVASVSGSTCVLPVSLVYFNGNASGKHVLLNWKAAQEINMNTYSLERSIDGVNFSTIHNIQAFNAASSIYNYTDTNILSVNNNAVFYYRLKQIQQDGSYKYTATILVRRNNTANVIEPLHNLFTDKLEISAHLQKAEKVTFNLFDAIGRLYYKKELLINNGSSNVTLDDMSFLNNGYYFLQVVGANISKTFKVLKK